MKVCRHTSHGFDTRPQVPRQKIDKFANVCRNKPDCVSTRVGQSKNQATQVDTIADQVDTPDISPKATSQVLSGCRHQQGCVSTQDTFPEAQAVNFQTTSKKLLAGRKSSCLLPLLSKCFQKTNFHQFKVWELEFLKTPLKHSKEADPVEDFFGEEFEEDPTSQIAEHRLGLQASQNSLVGCQERTTLTRPGQPSHLLSRSSRFDRFWGRSVGGHRSKVTMPMGVATWALSRWVAPSRLGGRRFKTEAAPHSPPLVLSLALLSLLSSLAVSHPFFMLLVLVLRLWRRIRAGDVVVVLGVRRRWSFQREGSNESALLVDVGTLDPLTLSMLPSPYRWCFLMVWVCGSVRIMLVLQ
ncbi:hypothetical protein Taro_047251 [Colocasia esculenta]|uniref:Uncharacterized protein n=1 Tax=Colocasia esculenta TaxID=4460 RepID=A0A843WUT7_COLES|nr:hypothetical protein [Colocasia esculenta]